MMETVSRQSDTPATSTSAEGASQMSAENVDPPSSPSEQQLVEGPLPDEAQDDPGLISEGFRDAGEEISARRGLAHVITLQNRHVETVVGLTFLPDLQYACVVCQSSGKLWLYPLDGRTWRQVSLQTSRPVGITALRQAQNTVAVASKTERVLNLVNLTGNEQIGVARQTLWKLHFRPFDVANCKADRLLILDGDASVVWIFTEEGQQLGSIRMQTEAGLDLLTPSACIWMPGCVWLALNNALTETGVCVAAVNKQGEVERHYNYRADGQGRHEVTGLCQVLDGHVAIAFITGTLHLVSADGALQKVLPHEENALTTAMCFDRSTERPRLFLAHHTSESGSLHSVWQLRIYDYYTLLSSSETLGADEDS